jgi:hypothetical protein
MRKLKTGYSDLSPEAAAELGDTVVANMTGVALWSAFAALITALPATVQAVRDAMTMTGPAATATVQVKTAVLAAALGAIADKANKTTGVTEPDLAGTGMPLVKERTATTDVPPAPTNLRLRHGNMPNTVDGTCDPIPGGNIRSYEGQSTLDANAGPWSDIIVFPNSRSLHFTGLTRGKDTWFRVRARNIIGAGPWSDPATIMVT